MSQQPSMQLRGGVALVTGAASGIGASVAIQLAGKGCHLALVDYQADRLEEVATKARALGVEVHTHMVDLSLPNAVVEIDQFVQQTYGRLTVLINNAGVAVGGNFDQVSEANFDWLMQINFVAVVKLTRIFLPLLEKEPAAQIVNISSLFGIIAPPGQTAYCASKFAVRGFSESLRHELTFKKSGVGLTLVHPGGVRTRIAQDARLPANVSAETSAEAKSRMDRLLTLSPDIAAAQIIQAIEQRQPRLIIGKDARAAIWIQRLFPVTYWRIIGGQMMSPPEKH